MKIKYMTAVVAAATIAVARISNAQMPPGSGNYTNAAPEPPPTCGYYLTGHASPDGKLP